MPGTYLVEVKRELALYDFHFDRVTTRQGPNYRDLAAHFTVRRYADLIGVMEPAKRNFSSRGTAVTQSALMTRGVSQLYLSLGDPNRSRCGAWVQASLASTDFQTMRPAICVIDHAAHHDREHDGDLRRDRRAGRRPDSADIRNLIGRSVYGRCG